MTSHLFHITEHPVDDRLIMRTFEIVEETQTLYRVQPRMIPNKQAQTVTRTVKKADVSTWASPVASYFHSPKDAFQAFKEDYRQRIHSAKGKIAHSQEQIRRADRDLLHEQWDDETTLPMPSSDCSASF